MESKDKERDGLGPMKGHRRGPKKSGELKKELQYLGAVSQGRIQGGKQRGPGST